MVSYSFNCCIQLTCFSKSFFGNQSAKLELSSDLDQCLTSNRVRMVEYMRNEGENTERNVFFIYKVKSIAMIEQKACCITQKY